MTDAADSVSPAHYSFRPASADALWQQISTPRPTGGKARRLGEPLVHAGLLTAPGLWHGLQVQQQEPEKGQHRPIGQSLVELGALTQEQLRAVIASWLGEYQVHPGDLKPEAAALALVPRAMAERESVLPLLIREDTLVLLMIDPGKRSLLDELRFLTQRRLIALQAAPDTLRPATPNPYQPPPPPHPQRLPAPRHRTRGGTGAGRAQHIARTAQPPGQHRTRRCERGRCAQRVGHPGTDHQRGDRRGHRPQRIRHPHRDRTGPEEPAHPPAHRRRP